MSDDEDHNQTFEQAGSGASLTYPVQCSTLRKNGHVVIKGRPCKIIEMSTSKTGKHGHAKVHLVATDIFTDKKLEDICPSTHNMDVPNVNRKEYDLSYIDDTHLVLLDQTTGDEKKDVKVPEGTLGDQIREAEEKIDGGDQVVSITVMTAMGEEHAVAYKLK
ncbi:translation protein SH3-like domain-containing protein [Hygrophoropsis aurantiaca]|uniref:Translation protein SH3-like domain-containing protein n=1 Tax=Hygrophoropsis aurantiaca TaxID=72124 RepID=A0ACB8AF39_9AGAM|nr:translation protein SH3-like domain-containing protein [Hygrophoropsis aurantiaca]